LEKTPGDDHSRPIHLFELSKAKYHRYTQYTKDLDDLAEAIIGAEQAVITIAAEHPVRPSLLGHWGNLIRSRFEATQDVKDMELAVEKVGEVAATAGENCPDRGILLGQLADRLMGQFKHTLAKKDLEASLIWAGQAVVVLEAGHANIQRVPSLSTTGKMKTPIDHTQEIVYCMTVLDVSAAKFEDASKVNAQTTSYARSPTHGKEQPRIKSLASNVSKSAVNVTPHQVKRSIDRSQTKMSSKIWNEDKNSAMSRWLNETPNQEPWNTLSKSSDLNRRG